jgi:hypothetical protein
MPWLSMAESFMTTMGSALTYHDKNVLAETHCPEMDSGARNVALDDGIQVLLPNQLLRVQEYNIHMWVGMSATKTCSLLRIERKLQQLYNRRSSSTVWQGTTNILNNLAF